MSNPIIDISVICLEQFFYFLASPTGTWKDSTGRVVIRLHYFKKATITRDGATTAYRRVLNGDSTTLRRPGFQLVLNHHQDGSITDATGTRFTPTAD
jgi:hypothetical protein